MFASFALAAMDRDLHYTIALAVRDIPQCANDFLGRVTINSVQSKCVKRGLSRIDAVEKAPPFGN
jgi:hypothetical protein